MVLVDAEYFGVQTGVLTSKLSDNPQKVSGLAGITLAGYVASRLALVLESVKMSIVSYKQLPSL